MRRDRIKSNINTIQWNRIALCSTVLEMEIWGRIESYHP